VKVIKVIVAILVALMALALVVVGVGLYLTNRYLQSAAFKQQALEAAHKELGAEVRIDQLKASLFSGVDLRGVTIGNPSGFSGNLVTADAFVLRYRLLPLLSRRVEIEQLSLDKPVISLSQNDKGQWNYERIGAAEGETGPKSTTPAPPAATKSATSVPLDVVLSKLAVTRGALSMLDDSNKPLVRVEGIDFSSSVSLTDNKLTGSGKAGIDRIDLSEKLIVQKAGAQLQLVPDHLTLSSLRGELAGGTISGNVSVNFATGLLYSVSAQLTNSNVARLLQDAGARQVVSGTLNVTTSLAGTGGVSTIVGSGRVELDHGKLMEIPLLNLLGVLLQIDLLRDLSFDQCLVEYSISNNVMQTPVIRVTSPQVQITGNGSVALDKYTLNHNLTITLARGALDNTLPQIRSLFTEQPDGALSLNFKVWGPYDSPKTDLTKRITQNVGRQLLQNGLQQLFK
jgi:uncharacterized protein involved in outer membrane biogenesis